MIHYTYIMIAVCNISFIRICFGAHTYVPPSYLFARNRLNSLSFSLSPPLPLCTPQLQVRSQPLRSIEDILAATQDSLRVVAVSTLRPIDIMARQGVRHVPWSAAPSVPHISCVVLSFKTQLHNPILIIFCSSRRRLSALHCRAHVWCAWVWWSLAVQLHVLASAPALRSGR